MMRLLRIEFLKISQNTGVWVTLGGYLFMLLVGFLAADGILKGMSVNGASIGGLNIYALPEGWHHLTWMASWLNIIPAITMMILVGNEYSYKTLRAQLINGMSRNEYFMGKILVILLLSLGSTLLIFLAGAGFGAIYTDGLTGAVFLQKINYLGAYFLQLFGFMLAAFFTSTLIRKTGFAIIALIVANYMLIPILDGVTNLFFDVPPEGFLPMESFDDLIPAPMSLDLTANKDAFQLVPTIASLVWCAVFGVSTWLLIQKRDQ